MFIATLDQVQHPNDFVVVGNIVLQNMDGKLIAFDNICPHRGNQLQRGSGNRPLVCSYHGWSFDQDGKLLNKGIKACNENDQARLTSACLKTHQVKTIGNFIFVGDEDYTDMHDRLLAISATMKNFLGENTITFNAKLPLVVENTLESYHVKTVHRSTFYEQGMKARPTKLEYYKNGSAMTVPTNRRDFHHVVAYPNLSIGILGVTTYVGILKEVGNTTEFYYRLYGPSFVRQGALELTDKVLIEDKQVIDCLQAALDLNPEFEPILTDLEPRIKHYQDWRLTCIP